MNQSESVGRMFRPAEFLVLPKAGERRIDDEHEIEGTGV
jgi:hypothetical protein